MQHSAWTEEVKSQYLDKGIGYRLPSPKRPAIVVVDLILGFTDSSFPAGSNLDSVVSETRRLLDRARKFSVPVIFTTIAFAKAQVNHLPWVKKMPALAGLQEGSQWTQIDPRLGVLDDEPVFTKRAASAFGGTDLAPYLASRAIDSVLICGATTSGCVRATAVDACMNGLLTFVPAQCVGDRAQEPHAANLFDIQSKYGDVIDLADALVLLDSVDVV